MGGHCQLTAVVPSLWTWWALSAHCSVSLSVGVVGTVSSLQWFSPCGRGGHCRLTVVVPSLWAWWALSAHCSGSLPTEVPEWMPPRALVLGCCAVHKLFRKYVSRKAADKGRHSMKCGVACLQNHYWNAMA